MSSSGTRCLQRQAAHRLASVVADAPAADPMTRYRYRTFVVVGPWRPSRRDAMADAVRNGFAQWLGPPWQELKWRFPGEIETDERER